MMLACSVASVVVASPEDDQVANYLRSHQMMSLLESQLESRIEDAKDLDEREQLTNQLSQLYLDQIRKYDRNNALREVSLNRARRFIMQMGSSTLYELRIELLVDEYTELEPKVELKKLLLLDDLDLNSVIEKLDELANAFDVICNKLDPAVAQLERLVSRSTRSSNPELFDSLADLRRYRSLAHYYHGWAGYSLAVLKAQHVPSDILISFGWLTGSEGGMPQISLLNESTLEFEHVARAAIGIALSYAQSEDTLSARSWTKRVVESEFTQSDSKLAAEDRYLQILAMDRDWTQVNILVSSIQISRGSSAPMRVADARFLAIQSLQALQSSRVGQGGEVQATKTAKDAITQLVEQGEIGHVLDLYRRFKKLPLIEDSFITRYAKALVELSNAESSSKAGMYASIASQFAIALESPGASQFPKEQADCRLKLAYVEIRADRPAEAIKSCDLLINSSSDPVVIEEARWMRIAAYESISLGSNNTKSNTTQLDNAVREYIVAYPSTSRSAKLLLRHAMQGTVDSQTAIDTLAFILDEDPIVIPARRTLVQLRYQQLRAIGYTDEALQEQILEMILWIDEHHQVVAGDIDDARAQLAIIRIGIELSIRSIPPKLDDAKYLIQQGDKLVAIDPSFNSYRPELVFRTIQVSLLDKSNTHRIKDSIAMLDELASLDPKMLDSARVLIVNALIQEWEQTQSLQLATQLIQQGSRVLALQTPPHPEPLGKQVSAITELVAAAAEYLWIHRDDADARDLAMRLSKLVHLRGQPSLDGLLRTTRVANATNDLETELESWLRLLAAYPSKDDRRYQARFESLRVMKDIDFPRAFAAYDQYRLLHPDLGPAPWNEWIAALFGDSVPSDSTSGEIP